MKTLNIGMLGHGFMGKAHSRAFRDVCRFFDLPLTLNMKTICGQNRDVLLKSAALFGWTHAETDWKAVVSDPEIDIIDIATPNHLHKEQVIAAAKNGKNIICEKPLANCYIDAYEMAKAAEDAEIKHFVLFNYRRVPAVALAREMILAGDIGDIIHFRAFYHQDWLMNPQVPLLWRMQKEFAGSGALGDIGSHIIDMAYFLAGEIEEVVSTSRTIIKERPLMNNPQENGDVDVDDSVSFLAKFKSGIDGIFDATRFATGRKNYNGFEIFGSKGTLTFNFESMNELNYYSGGDRSYQRGFKKILVTENNHPYIKSWWPPGHIIGYEHTFVNAFYDFLVSIKDDTRPRPDFFDAAEVQAVVDAVIKSSEEKRWIRVTDVK